jgi:hypothetical protein
MHTNQSPYQFQTLIGTGYVQEHHSDEAHPSMLGRDEERREIRFASILEALRSALNIRR